MVLEIAVATPRIREAIADVDKTGTLQDIVADGQFYGMRTFEQLNQSMSKITGVPTTNTAVRATYLQVQQQLPPVPSIEAFLASNQTGVAQLAIKYCSVMVDTPAARAAFFPALTLGIFWKRANKWGATLGMIAGLGITFYYMATTQPWLRSVFKVSGTIAENTWWGISAISAGVIGR